MSRQGHGITQAHVDACADAAVIAATDTFTHLSRFSGTDPMAAALRAFDANFPPGATRDQIALALVHRASLPESTHV